MKSAMCKPKHDQELQLQSDTPPCQGGQGVHLHEHNIRQLKKIPIHDIDDMTV